jgi:hypothetical protein
MFTRRCCPQEYRQHRAGRYCGGRMTRERAGPRFFAGFFFADFFVPAFLFFIAMNRLRQSRDRVHYYTLAYG